MKIALGIHVGHDRGACIIKDGKVLAALSQERIDRIKHSQSIEIPFETIDSLLKYCNLTINDISCIGLSHVAIEGEAVKNMHCRDFFNYYKCEYIPFYFVSHHDAHAYSSYFSSGFNESLIFVADGGGDFIDGKQESETIYIAKDGNIQKIDKRLQNMAVRHMKDPINHLYPFMPTYVQNLEMSLARKYSQITHLLGFKSGEEGKTMGLASYGKSIINYSNLNFNNLSFSTKYSDIIKELNALQLFSNKRYKDYIKENRADIAKTVQSYIENAVISIIKNYLKLYPCKNLCLSGGLFLNCLTNHKIIENCNLENIFILPASGDDGQALGSAYYAYLQQFGKTKFNINLPYLGLSYSDDKILQDIKTKNLKYIKYDNDQLLASKIAEYIKSDKIIAFVRGRSEFGPRALCHRSILANPTNPNMKDILNNRVKHREEFRPFAPTVSFEDQFKYFDLKVPSEYMLFATTVKKEFRSDLCAITHVDNTARIQAISKEKDPFLHLLLKEMEKITGYPILLNTSFNVAGQPIVESPLDALNTFLCTDIDLLILENYIIFKS
ncbi:carbamoyltransferase family protein [Faecalibacillus intestinalis]|uniref:carbamoyltransferase family protein n=1 Tax=Faecalibacillus intestinalis TaxID=1982626 RepID=UPI0022E83CEB|nr:carbamoyltransferase C-terminal domain-containing protein [Faecalibacillus intestinalis]